MSAPASVGSGDFALTISSPAGIPLSMAGFLLRAIGTAYPSTRITQAPGFSPGLALLIDRADFLTADTDADIADLVPDKDDPALVAFTSGFRDGGVGVSPPPWLAALLIATSEQIIEAADPPNYLEMRIGTVPGEWHSWSITRPGGRTPHELRRAADARVAVLEAQLRSHGIEPEAGGS